MTQLMVQGFNCALYDRNKRFKDGDISLVPTSAFSGEGIEEIATVTAVDPANAPSVSIGDVVVKVDPRYFRPAEVETLLGDPSKAKEKLGWVPEITVEEMCAEMVANDLDIAKRHALLKSHGYDISVAKES